AFGAWGNLQVGHVLDAGVSHASAWTGSAGTWQDLNPALPPGFGGPGQYAQAEAVWSDGVNSEVVGWASNTLAVPPRFEAVLWNGFAGTWSGSSLHPTGADESRANAVFAGRVAGTARFLAGEHAAFWDGSAASFVD